MLKARLKCTSTANSLIVLACHMQTSVRNSAVGFIAQLNLNPCTLYAFIMYASLNSLKIMRKKTHLTAYPFLLK